MSLFHRKPGPILKQSEYTVVLAAEVDDPAKPGRLTRLLYTGHDGDRGVLRAIVPGGEVLWGARFASEHDIREGLIAQARNVVVTHDPAGKALVGHEMWTGQEVWRTPIGQLVGRLGIDRSNHEVVAVTLDHVVHGLDIASGTDRPRGTVMTDEACAATMNATDRPCSDSWNRGNERAAPLATWSRIYQASDEVHVLRRDWAGTETWGLVRARERASEPFRELGQGSFAGAQQVGAISVLNFDVRVPSEAGDTTQGHQFFLFGAGATLLAVLREDGPSEFFDQGASFWKGPL
jgi:hypothetical protein